MSTELHSCIICLEDSSEIIQPCIQCKCSFHQHCWDDFYSNQGKHVKCPQCRALLATKEDVSDHSILLSVIEIQDEDILEDEFISEEFDTPWTEFLE